MKYPVLLKAKTGQGAAHSHTFYCVQSEAGMREALAFEGYDGELLIQAYVGHYEQVYKVYGVGDWFMPCIRKSLPHSELMSKDAYKFSSQKKWDDH